MRASEFIINLEQHDRNLLTKALLKRLNTEKERQRRQREIERQRRIAKNV